MKKKDGTQKIYPEPVQAKAKVNSPKVGLRGYFAYTHFIAAKRFAELAEELESQLDTSSALDLHKAYVVSAVVSAVAFAEAAINEILKDAFEEVYTYIDSLDNQGKKSLSEFWQDAEEGGSRKGILDKYQTTLELGGKAQFLKGEEPYQVLN